MEVVQWPGPLSCNAANQKTHRGGECVEEVQVCTCEENRALKFDQTSFSWPGMLGLPYVWPIGLDPERQPPSHSTHYFNSIEIWKLLLTKILMETNVACNTLVILNTYCDFIFIFTLHFNFVQILKCVWDPAALLLHCIQCGKHFVTFLYWIHHEKEALHVFSLLHTWPITAESVHVCLDCHFLKNVGKN